MNLLKEYIDIVFLENGNLVNKKKKIFKHLIYLLKTNNNISNIRIDEIGDIQFEFEDETYALVYYLDELTIKLFKSYNGYSWIELFDDLEILLHFLDIDITETTLERFIYELT